MTDSKKSLNEKTITDEPAAEENNDPAAIVDYDDEEYGAQYGDYDDEYGMEWDRFNQFYRIILLSILLRLNL